MSNIPSMQLKHVRESSLLAQGHDWVSKGSTGMTTRPPGDTCSSESSYPNQAAESVTYWIQGQENGGGSAPWNLLPSYTQVSWLLHLSPRRRLVILLASFYFIKKMPVFLKRLLQNVYLKFSMVVALGCRRSGIRRILLNVDDLPFVIAIQVSFKKENLPEKWRNYFILTGSILR